MRRVVGETVIDYEGTYMWLWLQRKLCLENFEHRQGISLLYRVCPFDFQAESTAHWSPMPLWAWAGVMKRIRARIGWLGKLDDDRKGGELHYAEVNRVDKTRQLRRSCKMSADHRHAQLDIVALGFGLLSEINEVRKWAGVSMGSRYGRRLSLSLYYVVETLIQKALYQLHCCLPIVHSSSLCNVEASRW